MTGKVHIMYTEVCWALCILNPPQIVIPFNTLWSDFYYCSQLPHIIECYYCYHGLGYTETMICNKHS